MDIWEFLTVLALALIGSIGVSILSEVQKVVRLVERYLTTQRDESKTP